MKTNEMPLERHSGRIALQFQITKVSDKSFVPHKTSLTENNDYNDGKHTAYCSIINNINLENNSVLRRFIENEAIVNVYRRVFRNRTNIWTAVHLPFRSH